MPELQAINFADMTPVLFEFVKSCAADPNYKSPGDREAQQAFVLVPPEPGVPCLLLCWPTGTFITSTVQEITKREPDLVEFRTNNSVYRLRAVPVNLAGDAAEAN